ncbi:MAG TPA: glycosyltransferase family 2 protein, partial [Vampirovibrionales bacterium]
MKSIDNSDNEKLPISGFIIALNEEEMISDCLQSLSFCSEIIVVDSGSDDFTKPIAESFGAKVVYRKFTNYREQKQFALEQCDQPWVLSLDADERISQEAYTDIKNINFENTEIKGYEFKRLH